MQMTTDIYRTANLLIEAYGEMAPVGAAIKADQCLQTGDSDGRQAWLRVARCVEELMANDSVPAGAVIN
jgi:hypothetical protein